MARIQGRVLDLHRKGRTEGEHGLPKPSVPEARIVRAGVDGDFNLYRHEEKHDDPAMALLVMPSETLRALDREGWPVRSGDLGENITTEGIPYAAFEPGKRFRAGQVVFEVTKPCTPCENLYLLPYVGRERGPEFLKIMVDRRGWYARVLMEGRIRTGDPIVEWDGT